MIDIKLPVLEKDHPWWMHFTKLEEESREVISAIQTLDYTEKYPGRLPKLSDEAAANVVAETLDLIQMCVGILDKVLEQYPILKEAELQHIEKLYSRGWKFKKWLAISED